MPERFLLPSVDIRMFFLLGDRVRRKLSEAKMKDLSSLSSAIARGESDKQTEIEPTVKVTTLHFDVTCPWCLSADTKPLNPVMGIFECCDCGEVFGRPSAG